MSEHTRRIIGLDPGLQVMGWGVIDVVRDKLTHIANGSIATSSRCSLAERLVQLETGLVQVMEQLKPQEAAVENTFVNRDGAATLKLGQARAITLLVPARAGLPVAEYAPNEIKKIVTGSGHASKQQITAMLRMLLPKAEPTNEHSADALAIAIAHAYTGQAKFLKIKEMT
jgi:crossover junction endodeoxyribonuclease RuvC